MNENELTYCIGGSPENKYKERGNEAIPNAKKLCQLRTIAI